MLLKKRGKTYFGIRKDSIMLTINGLFGEFKNQKRVQNLKIEPFFEQLFCIFKRENICPIVLG